MQIASEVHDTSRVCRAAPLFEIRAVGGIDKHCNKVREEAMEVVKQVVSVQPHLNETKYCIGFYCPGSLSSHLKKLLFALNVRNALIQGQYLQDMPCGLK